MYEIHAEERQVIGRTVKTWEREIIDACMLKAAAGTTGYQGGDTGHGCRTYLRLSDIGGADMRCRLFDAHGERGVEIALGGDAELHTLLEALEFVIHVLKDQIEEALTKHRNWVCWKAVPDQRKGRIRKVPMNARTGQAASSTDSATWCSVEEALEGCKRFLYPGVGFVFTPETGLVGVDIDHCIDPQTHEWNETARAVYERCPTYAEYSPSGTGLHLFYFGAMPGKGNKNSVTGVEMYGDTRYFTMTGKRVNGCPDMPAQGGDALRWIHETYVASKRASKRKKVKRRAAALTDEAVLDKARAAQNGELFNALWEN